MADNEFAARKSEGAGAAMERGSRGRREKVQLMEDERWRRWMQTMKKKIISKNIVCETCNAVCQRVCYHKTNFSATDINPDCRLSNIFCSLDCADISCSKTNLECSVLHPCEECSKVNLEEEARAAAREFDEHGERSSENWRSSRTRKGESAHTGKTRGQTCKSANA